MYDDENVVRTICSHVFVLCITVVYLQKVIKRSQGHCQFGTGTVLSIVTPHQSLAKLVHSTDSANHNPILFPGYNTLSVHRSTYSESLISTTTKTSFP